jgi:hypothetical protein
MDLITSKTINNVMRRLKENKEIKSTENMEPEERQCGRGEI